MIPLHSNSRKEVHFAHQMRKQLDFEYLDFMISAPSQGVVAIASRVDDLEAKEILQKINHEETQICVEIERNFLRTLEGGCTAPIGAIAKFDEGKITFEGKLNSLDGRKTINLFEKFEEINKTIGGWGFEFGQAKTQAFLLSEILGEEAGKASIELGRNLGNLNLGYLCELSVLAKHVNQELPTQYQSEFEFWLALFCCQRATSQIKRLQILCQQVLLYLATQR